MSGRHSDLTSKFGIERVLERKECCRGMGLHAACESEAQCELVREVVDGFLLDVGEARLL